MVITGRRLPSETIAGIAQLVEHNLAKVGVAGSSPVSRFPHFEQCAQKRELARVRGWARRSNSDECMTVIAGG